MSQCGTQGCNLRYKLIKSCFSPILKTLFKLVFFEKRRYFFNCFVLGFRYSEIDKNRSRNHQTRINTEQIIMDYILEIHSNCLSQEERRSLVRKVTCQEYRYQEAVNRNKQPMKTQNDSTGLTTSIRCKKFTSQCPCTWS